MKLSESAMLVRVHITRWTARRHDKKASARVAEENRAEADVGRYYKSLVKSDTLDELRRVCSRTRLYVEEKSLPWMDDGVRILPADMYLTVVSEFRKSKRQFEELADEFSDEYEDLRETSKERLGGLYRVEDYPSRDDVRRRFTFTYSFLPIPEASDWRVQVGEKHEKEIKKQITEQLEATYAEAARSLWERLYEQVSRMHKRLSEADTKFHDSLVNNLTELVELLPKLNVMQDPKLEKMAAEIRISLCSTNPGTLREDPKVRQDKAKEAKKIMDRISPYVGQKAKLFASLGQ